MTAFRQIQSSPATCRQCGETSSTVAETLSLCKLCIEDRFPEVFPHIREVHAISRKAFDLPEKVPRSQGGQTCHLCGNECVIGSGERGFCGLRENRNGRLQHLGGTKKKGFVSWYYDALPTNCVASWACPAGSDCGHPEFSYAEGPEYGYKNLAVFYEACTFNCLFCQNWHFRETDFSGAGRSAEQLAQAVDSRTACICYFGGDPTPQLPHAIAASRLALARLVLARLARTKKPGRILRICWETNGSMRRSLLKEMIRLSLTTGGCIKFDLKAFGENLHVSLCGTSNRQTLENFRFVAQFIRQRPDPPLLIASTLLVPGYIDAEEVGKIARFIAALDPSIPYSLLAFYPQFYFHDLPVTSRKQAEDCYQAAVDSGLTRVNIGNRHLLGAE